MDTPAPGDELLPPIDPNVALRLGWFADHIDGLVRHGTRVLAWGADQEGHGDHLIPAIFMFRRMLDVLGGVGAQVRASWADSAAIGVRTLLEHTFYLEYLLVKDSQRRGLSYLICDWHAEASFLRKLDPQSQEGKHYVSKLGGDRILSKVKLPMIPDREARLQDVERSLASEKYHEIEAEYRRIKLAKGGKPKWHMLFNETATTVEILATQLGHAGLYEVFYRDLSRMVHGESVSRGNLSATDDMRLQIHQIQSSEHAQEVTSMASTLMLMSFKTFLEFLAPARLTEHAEWAKGILPIRAVLRGPPLIVTRREQG